MGARADFYVGRGERAEWIGSVAYGFRVSGVRRTASVDFSRQSLQSA